MAKPFDATLNALIDVRPEDWANGFARIAGIPPGPSTVLDTDLATTVQADKVFRIDGPSPSILHLELEANPRLGIPRELSRYNTLIDHAHDLPVETVLILLRPKALASDLTGRYDRVGVSGNPIRTFHYHVVKVWERPVDFWLNAGIALAPLAMLSDEASGDLDRTLDRLRGRMRDEGVEEPVTGTLLGSSYVLCGLRYDPERIAQMYRRLNMLMEESTTYQWIVQQGVAKGRNEGRNEGRTEEAKKLLLRQGTRRFGVPSSVSVAALNEIADLNRLEQLADRIFDATSWDDLLKAE